MARGLKREGGHREITVWIKFGSERVYNRNEVRGR